MVELVYISMRSLLSVFKKISRLLKCQDQVTCSAPEVKILSDNFQKFDFRCRTSHLIQVPFKLLFLIHYKWRTKSNPPRACAFGLTSRTTCSSVPCREVFWYCLQKEWLCLTTFLKTISSYCCCCSSVSEPLSFFNIHCEKNS